MLTAFFIFTIGISLLITWLVITRGLQLKRLTEDGVEVEGTVIRQFKHNPRGSKSTDHFLRYRYRDTAGGEHEGKSNVSYDVWNAHPEGKALALVYSNARPSLSAPRFLVEQARQALAKRKQASL